MVIMNKSKTTSQAHVSSKSHQPCPLAPKTAYRKNGTLKKDFYETELCRLQTELVKLQEWILQKQLKVVVLFEGRDAAGKGGVIKRMMEKLNPRICHVVALGTPTEREKNQWYFQRYVPHLPAKGEMILFDRSWYNRAGVERVMEFCDTEEYLEFFQSCPDFERLLVRSGIHLIKYWFSVSDQEQEARFQARINDPTKRWKISPMDLQSRARWEDYTKAKDAMFLHTHINEAPWNIIPADDKHKARLNAISHLLGQFSYKDLTQTKVKLPKRQKDSGYQAMPTETMLVPKIY